MSGAVRFGVKICGLCRREDAQAAEAAGADYLGVVLTAGFGRSVTPDEAARIFAGTRAAKVAVLVDESAEEALAKADAIGAAVLQLHGDESVATVRALRDEGRHRLWKGVRAETPADVAAAVERYGGLVDGFLVEGRREGFVGGGGATLAVDPVALRVALGAGADFVLAGGLDPDNVAEAVARFMPHVVDVSSGVESAAREKDPARIAAFVRRAREAAAGAAPPTHVPQGRTE